MDVLVCGGAGYIGSHMCKKLAREGNSVTVFDNLSTGHEPAVKWGERVRGDLLNPEDLKALFSRKKFHAVMHFAAASLVGESVQRPGFYFRNNVGGALNLLDAMVEHGVSHLIFSSTAAVYGQPESNSIDENSPLRPINPYGESKLMIENHFPYFERAHGIRSVSLRYFNAAGADPDGELGELHDPETHLIPNILKSLAETSPKSLKVFGVDYDTRDGTCIRDYIHINDLCDAHLMALDSLIHGGGSEIFNLGNGRGFSVLEVIQAAKKVTGREIPYAIAERREGDPPVLVANCGKIRERLGWKPKFTTIESIIQTAWNWHRNPTFNSSAKQPEKG